MSRYLDRLFLLLPMAALGCGGGAGDVAGKVTFNGKPVVVGYVVAIGSDSAVYVSGDLSDTGGYVIPSLPAGPAKFAVYSRTLAKARKPVDRDSAARGKSPRATAIDKKWFAIGDQFRDPCTSGLTYDIRSGSNQFDIVLVGQMARQK